nr:TIGR00366 family protein [Fredinandcohnia onubensis]
MISRLSRFFSKLMENYLPESYIFAITLTLITYILALIFVDIGPFELVGAWGEGLWQILNFAMQMMLILLTGHCLALSAPVQNLLNKISRIAKTPKQAVFIVAFVAAIASWINWGFGLIVGGLLALQLAKRQKVHYPLLIAAAYSGFVIWHMGLSATAPLTSASAGNPANHVEKVFGMVIPITDSIFAWWNLVPAVLILFTMPLVLYMAYPKRKEDIITVDPAKLEDTKMENDEVIDSEKQTFAQRLENSKLVNLILIFFGVSYIVNHFVTKGFNLDINVVIGIFLFAGIILHKTPMNYANAMKSAIKGASGIALQFPLYGGIIGIMNAGLAVVIANWFLSISTEHTFYLFQFLSAGVVNFFIPSGGGQWAAQGLITMEAAKGLGMDPAISMMTVAWGDQWTNMIQPLWALPILGLAGLKSNAIMGYTLLTFLWTGLIFCGTMLLLAFLG